MNFTKETAKELFLKEIWRIKTNIPIPSINKNKPDWPYEQWRGNCWRVSAMTDDYCNNGILRKNSIQTEIAELIKRFWGNPEEWNQPINWCLFYSIFSQMKKEKEPTIYEYPIPNPKDKEALGKMLKLVGDNLKRGRCMIYSRTSSNDIKKDIKDNLFLDSNEAYSNDEAWHAVVLSLADQKKGILEEQWSYNGSYYNKFKFDLSKLVQMIYDENIRGSFIFLVRH